MEVGKHTTANTQFHMVRENTITNTNEKLETDRKWKKNDRSGCCVLNGIENRRARALTEVGLKTKFANDDDVEEDIWWENIDEMKEREGGGGGEGLTDQLTSMVGSEWGVEICREAKRARDFILRMDLRITFFDVIDESEGKREENKVKRKAKKRTNNAGVEILNEIIPERPARLRLEMVWNEEKDQRKD